MATRTTSEQAETSVNGHRPAKLPDDPAAFVAEAERASNLPDLPVLDDMYAENAVFENAGDGMYARHEGGQECVTAWKVILGGMAGLLDVRKNLLGVTEDAIINEWTGTLAGRPTRGVEHWRFDADGKVVHHKMFNTVLARDATDARARLRMFLNYPRLSFRVVRGELKYRGRLPR